MSMLAQSWGHEAVVANDGPAALIVAISFRPDIALVDIGLPGMNGYEVARRETTNSIGVVLSLRISMPDTNPGGTNFGMVSSEVSGGNT